MNAFIWELNDGGSVAVIADSLPSARVAALGFLKWGEQTASSYHRKSECRRLRTLIESASIPQSLTVGQGPYVFLAPSPERVESGGDRGNISIGSMINSQIAIASPGASYAKPSRSRQLRICVWKPPPLSPNHKSRKRSKFSKAFGGIRCLPGCAAPL